jgi:hypothetical protein
MDEDPPTEDAPPPARRSPKRKGTPVVDMAAEDRALVTRTARRAYEILEILVERLFDQVVDAPEVPKLPVGTVTAMLNLQKMAAGMIDKHPGLLAELQSGGADPEATDDDLERILRAVDPEAHDGDG